MLRSGAQLDRVFDAALNQVLPRMDDNPCTLAGYSFGGIAAWEIARRLQRTIELMATKLALTFQ
jgi:thioesterase domain-containing protein